MQSGARGQAHYLSVGNAEPGDLSMSIVPLLPEKFVSLMGTFGHVLSKFCQHSLEILLGANNIILISYLHSCNGKAWHLRGGSLQLVV